jgi:surfactin synthase thioesterase subunit
MPDPSLRIPFPLDKPSLRLVCVPHAGAGASAYRDWTQWLPSDVELCAVQLPGREDRRKEAPLGSMAEAAELIVAGLGTLDARPTVLFGHSFGALLAFEALRRLEANNAQLPLLFCASGAREPHRVPQDEWLHQLADGPLLKAIDRHGGVPDAIRDAPDFFAAFAPILRSDFFLSENYTPDPEGRVSVPMLVTGGRDDTYVPAARMIAWRDFAAGPFTVRTFPGGHFYLDDKTSGFTAAFSDILNRLKA